MRHTEMDIDEQKLTFMYPPVTQVLFVLVDLFANEQKVLFPVSLRQSRHPKLRYVPWHKCSSMAIYVHMRESQISNALIPLFGNLNALNLDKMGLSQIYF